MRALGCMLPSLSAPTTVLFCCVFARKHSPVDRVYSMGGGS